MTRKFLTAVILLGLLLGAMLAGALAFNGSTASAQSASSSEAENEANEANEEPDTPITGSALDQASAAALDYLGEGQVTDTEVGDEEGYYEIEIRRENGRETDVHLDENFNILSHEDD